MPIVRTATRRDISAVDALLARAYPRLLKDSYAPHVMVTAVPILSRAQPALVTSGRYYVVDGYEGIIGAGGWSRGGRDRTTAEVRHLVTDDRFVRQGIGRAIMDTVFDAARAEGCTRMRCMATTYALPFYLAIGFAVRTPTMVTLQPGIDLPVVEMTKSLVPSLT